MTEMFRMLSGSCIFWRISSTVKFGMVAREKRGDVIYTPAAVKLL
jgi:hypothetical protein